MHRLATRPARAKWNRLDFACCCVLALPACGEDEDPYSASSGTQTDTGKTDGTSSTESSTQDDGGDGTPVEMWCFGEPGPAPDWAFAAFEGSFQVSSASACLPSFAATQQYELTLDGAARSATIGTEGAPRTFAWDEDALDGICTEEGQYPGGYAVTIGHDAMNSLEIVFSQGGQFEHVNAAVGSGFSCRMNRVDG